MALMVLGNALGSEAQHLSIASAIATIETALDEARKDKERLDWQDAQRWIEIGAGAEDMQVECEAGVFRGRSLRAAIDQARREENP